MPSLQWTLMWTTSWSTKCVDHDHQLMDIIFRQANPIRACSHVCYSQASVRHRAGPEDPSSYPCMNPTHVCTAAEQ